MGELCTSCALVPYGPTHGHTYARERAGMELYLASRYNWCTRLIECGRQSW